MNGTLQLAQLPAFELLSSNLGKDSSACTRGCKVLLRAGPFCAGTVRRHTVRDSVGCRACHCGDRRWQRLVDGKSHYGKFGVRRYVQAPTGILPRQWDDKATSSGLSTRA